MRIKKIFNYEDTLTSAEFIANKQDMISEQCQAKNPNMLCKVTTYCLADKQFVIHTTEENRVSLGAVERMLAHRPMADQSLLTLDNEMTNTWEINITADTPLPDYVTALDVAQSKVDAMFDEDKTKLPIVTVVDYRWGNSVTQVLPSVFGEVDIDGNTVPTPQPTPNLSGGNSENGKSVLSIKSLSIDASSTVEVDWTKNFTFKFYGVKKITDTTFLLSIDSGDDSHDLLLSGDKLYHRSAQLGGLRCPGIDDDYWDIEYHWLADTKEIRLVTVSHLNRDNPSYIYNEDITLQPEFDVDNDPVTNTIYLFGRYDEYQEGVMSEISKMTFSQS